MVTNHLLEEGMISVKSGASQSFYTIESQHGKHLNMRFNVSEDFDTAVYSLLSWDSHGNAKVTKSLDVKYKNSKMSVSVSVEKLETEQGCLDIALFCPYWIINKTYKPIVLHVPSDKSDYELVVPPNNTVPYQTQNLTWSQGKTRT